MQEKHPAGKRCCRGVFPAFKNALGVAVDWLAWKLLIKQLLFALSSLMTCPGQKLPVFMFPHLFPSFFYDATQQITPRSLFI